VIPQHFMPKLQHWRGFQAIFAWKGAPNGVLREEFPSPAKAGVQF